MKSNISTTDLLEFGFSLPHDFSPTRFSVQLQCYWQGGPLSEANFEPASMVVIMTKKVLSHNNQQTCRNWAMVTLFRSDDLFLTIVRRNELRLFGNTAHIPQVVKRSRASLFHAALSLHPNGPRMVTVIARKVIQYANCLPTILFSF